MEPIDTFRSRMQNDPSTQIQLENEAPDHSVFVVVDETEGDVVSSNLADELQNHSESDTHDGFTWMVTIYEDER